MSIFEESGAFKEGFQGLYWYFIIIVNEMIFCLPEWIF